MIWVKKLGTKKLDEKAEKGHFVGVNEKSRGYRVYCPGKKKVSIKQDVYFNKDESLQPNDTQIKEEWNIPVNLDIFKTFSEPDTTPSILNLLITP